MPTPLIGRDRELRELGESVERAKSGRGGLSLLLGEAGVGKSRLVAELAEGAGAGGTLVVFGHCWEAGGAPAFWPWTQVLRVLIRHDAGPFEKRRDRLLPLLPDLGASADGGPAVDAEHARFLLMDAVIGALGELASCKPLLLILEDLHVSDASSLALLELLAQQLRTLPVSVVGTARDLRRSSQRESLARLGRLGSSLTLGRLGAREIEGLLSWVLGNEPSAAVVERVFASTEGNPLYVLEVARGLRADRSDKHAWALPPSLRAMIKCNLERLSPSTLRVLEDASVLGRELAESELGLLLDADPNPALVEAEAQGVLEADTGRRWRFSHVLVRDVLEDGLEPARAQRLHGRAAQVLRSSAAAPVSSRLAHHLLRAGEEHRTEAREAAREAAEQALRQFAFDEAAHWFDAARGTITSQRSTAHRERCELLIARSRAELLAGDRTAGLRSAAEARGLARQLATPDLFAQACLAAGTVFTVAMVSEELVACLREALGLLPPEARALRARVQARLAAALQPAEDPAGPIAMALEAVATARSLDDRRVLLETLRSAMSALQDLAPPEQRLPLNREHLALAFELGEATHAFCALTRRVFDELELGNVAAASGAIASAASLASELVHPSFVWQAKALLALEALLERRFEAADEHAAQAQVAAERAKDSGALRTLLVQRIRRLDLEGRPREALELLPRLRASLVGSIFGEHLSAIWEAALHAKAGKGRLKLRREPVDAMLRMRDTSLFELAAEYAVHTQESELCAELHQRGLHFGRNRASWGAFAMVAGGPMAEILEALERVARSASPRPAPSPALAQVPELRMERAGEFWRVVRGDRELLVESRRGLAILARLVEERGRELHVLDLARGPGRGGPDPIDGGDAGAHLDPRARAEYQARLRELRRELEDAEDAQDLGRAARSRGELQAIEAEIARAFGLGGRERRVGSAVERARVNVQRRLKDAIRRIAAHDGALGKHLDRSVRTGIYCRYDP